MYKIKSLVVFDLDGTLNRTDSFSIPAHMQAIAEFGFPEKTKGQICATYGMGADDYMREIAPHADSALARKYLDRVSELEAQFIPEHGRPYDGVPKLLDQLHCMGLTTAVCSNASYRYISFVLESLNLINRIDFIQPLQKNQTKKDTLQILLKHVAPKHAVMVGDTIYDIEAGKSNGLKTVGCLYGFRPHEMEYADYQIQRPLALLDIIGSALPGLSG